MGLRGRDPSSEPPATSTLPFRVLAALSAAWAFLTILLGAAVTFTGSGLDCSDWPGCFPGAFFPSWGGGAAIEFLHRSSAFVLSLLCLVLFLVACFTRQARSGVRRLTAFAFLLVVAQALVGGLIIYTQESTAVVVLHLALATLLFGVLLVIAVVVQLPYLPPRWQRSLVGLIQSPRPREGEAPPGPASPTASASEPTEAPRMPGPKSTP